MIADQTSQSLDGLFSLQGKTAAVTGGARGIGAAICHRLAELGADVAVGDLDAEQAQRVADDLNLRYGIRAISRHLDVRSLESVNAFADAAYELGNCLDIWVNNAGVFPHGNIQETTESAWDDVMDVNLKGVFLGTKAAAERMLKSKDRPSSRVIVNMASVSSFVAQVGRAHYTSSKHAMMGLTKSAAREFGADGIRVLAIAPTLVSTPGLNDFNKDLPGSEIEAIHERLMPRLPLGRVCVPDDIARVVAFCATDLASMMTGSAIFVDGGFSAS